MKRVLLLHAYDGANRGDGLLVQEAVHLIRSVHPKAQIELVASNPDSFDSSEFTAVHCSKPRGLRFAKTYIEVLRSMDAFDLVVGVGGGYLRFGKPVESVKTSIIHLPQLYAASKTAATTIYLPQSIGPSRLMGTTSMLRRLTTRIDEVFVRDDRSLRLLQSSGVRRLPDMANLSNTDRVPEFSSPSGPVVVGTRSLRRKGRHNMRLLADQLGTFHGLVQSSVSGNNDWPAVSALAPVQMIETPQLLASAERRVVISVRLHGALMALWAGHYVIHLAYERKGFSAFEDLGLERFVHNVYDFEPSYVASQASTLLSDSTSQREFAVSINEAVPALRKARHELINSLEQS